MSRAAVSAVENGISVPSVNVALGLARAFETPVEHLFTEREGVRIWAWSPLPRQTRVWIASVGERQLIYPVEPNSAGAAKHDSVIDQDDLQARTTPPPRTLVMAGCDPAAALLAEELASRHGIRLLHFTRGSRAALDLLARGIVHVAGTHLPKNALAVRRQVGAPCVLLRLVRWKEGVALRPDVTARGVKEAIRANLKWVGREEGSAARALAEKLLQGHRRLPRGFHSTASDHRVVVAVISSGLADAGVCVEIAATERGLRFLPVQQENYDLCFRADMKGDPLIEALVETVRSQSLRTLLSGCPGYDTRTTGDLSLTN